MSTRIHRVSRTDSGFTLVELMVVVLVIGILVAVALPVFGAARASAEGRSCFTNQRTIEGAVQMYASNEGTHPPAGQIVAGSWCVPAYLMATPVCPADTGAVKTPYAVSDTGSVGTGAAGNADGCPVNAATSHGHY